MIEYAVSASTLGVINLLMVLGLNFQYGGTGDLNLSYYAFVALGALLTGVFNLPKATGLGGSQYILGLSLPFALSLAMAVVVCAVIGALLGASMGRLSGDYLAIGTLSAALIFSRIAGQSLSLFNGPEGLYGVGRPFNSLLGLSPKGYNAFFLGLCVVALAVVYVLVELLYRSPFGRGLRTIREDPLAAAAFGYDARRLRIKTFAISSAIAAFGGGLIMFYVTAFNPSSWAPIEVVLLLAAVLAGGTANNRGVLVGGAVLLSMFPQATLYLPGLGSRPDLLGPIRNIADGLAIMAVLWFRPQGIVPEPLTKATVKSVNRNVRPAEPPRHTVPRLRDVSAPTTEPPGVEVVDLVKHFGGVVAVDGCTFSAFKCSVTGLIGPNGAGKSTVVDMISGYLRPDSGSVFIDGQKVNKLPPYRIARLGLGRTFQTSREWPRLSTFENVLAGFPTAMRESTLGAVGRRRVIAAAEAEHAERALELLGEFGLSQVCNEYAGNLSGGQKRLLELARVAVARPAVLLLDEPLAGVNPGLWDEIGRAIERFARGGTAVLLVEHHLEFVEDLCDLVVVMAAGSVLMTGDMATIRASEDVVHAYLGDVEQDHAH